MSREIDELVDLLEAFGMSASPTLVSGSLMVQNSCGDSIIGVSVYDDRSLFYGKACVEQFCQYCWSETTDVAVFGANEPYKIVEKVLEFMDPQPCAKCKELYLTPDRFSDASWAR